MNYHGIEIDLSKDGLLNNFSISLLKSYYMLPEETSPQEAFARAALAGCDGDMVLAQNIYNAVANQWFMFASPILSNAPVPGQQWKALPISCFLSYVDDTLESIIDHGAETAWLSVKGGGVGAYWGKIRAISTKAPGPVPFLGVANSQMSAFSQGRTRRGSYAAYMDIEHPDIEEFLSIRDPAGGDINRKCLNIHHGINISDAFMEAVIEDQPWNLLDPNTKEVRSTISSRDFFQRILEMRAKTGEPYIHYIDTSNRFLPSCFTNQGLRINQSNLCTEILEPTAPKRTAVCCLSSLDLDKYDEWKDTDLVKWLIRFLDNILTVFINNCPDTLSYARNSAIAERSIGLGTMGFHSYLQKHNIPWESALAVGINHRIFSQIHQQSLEESIQLGKERGSFPDHSFSDDQSLPLRNALRIAIAPNANSSIIVGCSPSIEPWSSNAFTQKTRAGSFLVKNPYLETLLASLYSEAELEETWKSIILNGGSVQHLERLDEWQKSVYKTAFEINQEWVVQHAADRQPYIDQGQSVNLFFPAKCPRSYILKVHLQAWKMGLKTLYYYRTNSAFSADKVSIKLDRVSLSDYAKNDEEECLACHG